MYIQRKLEDHLLTLAGHFPVVAILGPRQAGKTTLAQQIRGKLSRESIYLDLENPVDEGALVHPVEFLSSVSGKVVIIDEIQRKPEIFPVLRSLVDMNRIGGRFILLGSASPDLLFLSTETLAGRIAFLELTPFMQQEISHLGDFREHWVKGGFPTPFLMNDSEIRREWFKSFTTTFVERDLKVMGLPTSPLNLRRLLMLLASMQGGLMNLSNLGNSLGISSPSVSQAILFLERSYMVRVLKPWNANIGKRLVKSPKIYIRDSGLLNYLLGISDYESLLRHPQIGNLWEGYVIEELINTLGDDYQYYFYRTADGAECDLILFRDNRCIAALETKFVPRITTTRSMTITEGDLKPEKSVFIVPDCQEPYQVGENRYVATPGQLPSLLTRQ